MESCSTQMAYQWCTLKTIRFYWLIILIQIGPVSRPQSLGGSPVSRQHQWLLGRVSNNWTHHIIRIGGFNPLEKYEFVRLDHHPNYWGK